MSCLRLRLGTWPTATASVWQPPLSSVLPPPFKSRCFVEPGPQGRRQTCAPCSWERHFAHGCAIPGARLRQPLSLHVPSCQPAHKEYPDLFVVRSPSFPVLCWWCWRLSRALGSALPRTIRSGALKVVAPDLKRPFRRERSSSSKPAVHQPGAVSPHHFSSQSRHRYLVEHDASRAKRFPGCFKVRKLAQFDGSQEQVVGFQVFGQLGHLLIACLIGESRCFPFFVCACTASDSDSCAKPSSSSLHMMRAACPEIHPDSTQPV